MTSNDAPRLYRYSRQYSTERRCYYVLLSEKIQNTTHGRLERDIDHSPLIESSRSSSAPSHVVCAVFRWVSDPYGPTVYPYCLSGLWDHTQDASLGQGVGGVSGNRSTVLSTSTCRGGLGKRRALRAILFLLVVFLFFVPWSSACTVVFIARRLVFTSSGLRLIFAACSLNGFQGSTAAPTPLINEHIYRGQRKTCPVKRFGGAVGFSCFVTAPMLVHPGSITPNQVMAKCITAACWHYSGRSISTPVASCSVSRPYILGKVAFNKI